jgi:hypothetical protein
MVAYLITLPIKGLSYYPATEIATLRRQQAGFLAIYIFVDILNTITLVSEETRLLSLFMKFLDCHFVRIQNFGIDL